MSDPRPIAGDSVFKLVQVLKASALERGDTKAAIRLGEIEAKVITPKKSFPSDQTDSSAEKITKMLKDSSPERDASGSGSTVEDISRMCQDSQNQELLHQLSAVPEASTATSGNRSQDQEKTAAASIGDSSIHGAEKALRDDGASADLRGESVPLDKGLASSMQSLIHQLDTCQRNNHSDAGNISHPDPIKSSSTSSSCECSDGFAAPESPESLCAPPASTTAMSASPSASPDLQVATSVCEGRNSLEPASVSDSLFRAAEVPSFDCGPRRGAGLSGLSQRRPSPWVLGGAASDSERSERKTGDGGLTRSSVSFRNDYADCGSVSGVIAGAEVHGSRVLSLSQSPPPAPDAEWASAEGSGTSAHLTGMGSCVSDSNGCGVEWTVLSEQRAAEEAAAWRDAARLRADVEAVAALRSALELDADRLRRALDRLEAAAAATLSSDAGSEVTGREGKTELPPLGGGGGGAAPAERVERMERRLSAAVEEIRALGLR